jgi:hypothetical protein
MRKHVGLTGLIRIVLIVGSLVLICPPVHAQWVKVPAGKIPRAPDGKPNLSAPAPRLPDGHADLSGIWEHTGNSHVQNIAADLKPGEILYQPWAKALVDARADGSHARDDPPGNCLPQGVPRINAAPSPWKIIQTPGLVAILYETFNLWRQVFLDGRELGEDFTPSWFGYSTGKWEGDTLVVDTRGFNGKAWIDQAGRPTTEALHVTERFQRKDFGHMEVQITIDDPKAYTKPWTVTEKFNLVTNSDLLEFICENNRDLEHLPPSPSK